MASFKWIRDQERLAIAKLIKKGCTVSEIARALDRSKSAIFNEIEKHGGREAYTVERFQDAISTVEEAKEIKESKKPKSSAACNVVLKKLSHLESQMEMMLLTIQSIRDQIELLEESL